MQVPEAALENLQKFADKQDSLWKEPLQVFRETIKKFRNTPNLRQGPLPDAEAVQKRLEAAYSQLLQRIEVRKRFYLNYITLADLSRLKQQLALLNQFVRFELLPMTEAVRYRDVCMAENLYWSSAHYGNAKTVLWAHNGHVSKYEIPFVMKPLGTYLKDTYKDKYVNIGFAFGEGMYQGIDPDTRKITSLQAEAASVGTYEYFFQSLNLPLSLLDLRKPQLSKETQWLYEVHNFRTIGAMRNGKEFTPMDLRQEFDLLLFIHKSTPAQGL